MESYWQHHASKFAGKADRRGTIRRYLGAAEEASSKPGCRKQVRLARLICHVCGWVAKLELPVLCRDCGDLTPIHLLAKMLSTLEKPQSDARLEASLDTASSCVKKWSQQAEVVCSESFESIEALQHELSLALASDEDQADGSPAMAREFQRCMSQWHSLTLEERKVKVSAWALRLKALQEETSVSKLRRLILQLTAALAPPRLAAAESQVGRVDGTRIVSEELKVKVSQQAVQKTLLRSLALWRSLNLDVSEIEIARLRIKHLTNKFEEFHANFEFVASYSLWRRLRAFACGEQEIHATSAGDKQKKKCQRRRPAVLSDGRMYDPGPPRKKLRTIEHRPSEPKLLKCERCSHELISCWYFVHPKTSRASVLVPNTGHKPCNGQAGGGLRAFFKPADGSKYKSDCTSGLVYCIHNRVQAVCAPGGGVNICQHGKQRVACAICKLKIRKRIKTMIPT